MIQRQPANPQTSSENQTIAASEIERPNHKQENAVQLSQQELTELARKVYQLLLHELRIERERLA